VKDIAGKLKPNFHDVVIPTGSGHAFANSYHEKVAVRDSAAFWLSSGNWTIKSQPDIDPVTTPAAGIGMYGKYNREWHVVLEDQTLAALFEKYILYDYDQAEQDLKTAKKAGKRAAAATVFPDIFIPLEAAVAAAALPPEPVAPKRLPSGGASYQVQPVLTPDNYRQRVSALLEGAQRSIYMQLAYINYSDAAGDATFTDLLNVVKKKIDQAGVDVRIIVDSRNGAGGVAALVEHGFNQTVFRQQTNIHNKGIVVDGEAVLVSSANWSSDGILRNRDAGLIIANAEVAGYYQQVFLDDWDKRATAIKGPSTAIVARPGAATPPGMVRVSWHEYMDD
jgi:phosphatidylserine/phosphatidylglycerophosphate/cardiolipin synthase-like enzyme